VVQLLAAMLDDLNSRDVEVRKRAVSDLERTADIGAREIRELATIALKDDDDEIRLKAAHALEQLGLARLAAPALITVLLRDKSKHIRVQAANALGIMGPVTAEVVPSLIKALNDPEFEVVDSAVGALSFIGPGSREAVPALMKLVETKGADAKDKQRADLRFRAAIALGHIGPEAHSAVPLLLGIVAGDDDHELQGTALVSLGEIGAREDIVIPVLVEALRNKKRTYLRSAAAYGVGRFGKKAKKEVPSLVAALDVSDISDPKQARRIQVGVLTGLGWIGPDASAAIPAIEKLLETPDLDIEVSASATTALEKIRPQSP
jgi:HEAT repeat protein